MKSLGPVLILASVCLSGWGTYHVLGTKKSVLEPAATRTAPPVNSYLRDARSRAPTKSRDLVVEQTTIAAVPANDHRLNRPALDLQQELALVKSQLKSIQQRLERQAADLQSLRRAGAAASDDPDPALVERNDRARQALMEDKMRNENVDFDWTADAIDSVELALNDDELRDTAILDINCRATVCRVEVDHTNREAFDRFQSRFLTQVSDILPDVLVEHTDLGNGATGTVIYLARDGYSLSGMPVD